MAAFACLAATNIESKTRDNLEGGVRRLCLGERTKSRGHDAQVRGPGNLRSPPTTAAPPHHKHAGHVRVEKEKSREETCPPVASEGGGRATPAMAARGTGPIAEGVGEGDQSPTSLSLSPITHKKWKLKASRAVPSRSPRAVR